MATINGTSNNDTINGTESDDIINAGSGDDTVAGGVGDDQIDGGDGNDTISGGVGNDSISGGQDNDTLTGDSGNDTLSGDGGNDQLDGGVGDDMLYGGDGDDTIVGGTGNDTLSGGAGDDILSGGVGCDIFEASQGGGNDTVTDFDLTVRQGQTSQFTDQIDISDLQNPDGSPVYAHQVVVTDDGNGNALLTFPEGETLVLQGVTPAQMGTNAQLRHAGIPCFTTGTMILTPNGEVPIDMLRPGSLVVTRDNGPQKIRWIGMRPVFKQELAANPQLAPIKISAGAFGNARDLIVSPQHGILTEMREKHGQQHLVRAAHLARLDGGKIRVMKGARRVTYVHMLFDAHQVVYANGIASESFYPGPWGMKALAPDVQLELLHLWPELGAGRAQEVYGDKVRHFSKFRELPIKQSDMQLMCA